MAKTLTAALNIYCRRENETNTDFLAALKALTAEDKQWYKNQFKTELNIDIE